MASTLFRRRGSISRSNSSSPTAQSNSPCGPAMKPSSVTNGEAITFLIAFSFSSVARKPRHNPGNNYVQHYLQNNLLFRYINWPYPLSESDNTHKETSSRQTTKE